MIKKITSAVKLMLGAMALVVMFTTAALAQDKAAENLTKLNDHMKTQLSLNDSQYVKVNDINRVFVTKAKESEKSNANKLDKAKKIKALEEDRDTKLKSVLTADQYKIFVANRGENTKKLKALLPAKE
ncbi:hypothetical protein Q765_18955 [Flavobacterium rivuli WB 3.3-2 = DSM 21788]|uniref:DUF4168 domain-containing protein n=1 Tax=Flavobacterium rivuli WB 3.3-2 = DSM 21788 TaxID=1121895 RepID=A0A0A2LZY6_9FLAO|nr:hypothetical protein [Flavobacterium rivuli]KGO84911.1 hypothetical protein Q765_18955 [Flavobacterium rivuli WB 3.3-2 = DSM 21788]